MSPDEHYTEAERLLALAHDLADQGYEARANFIVARAQVHATLASVDPATKRMWESLRAAFTERIADERAVATFRRVWAEAEARGESGDRVRQALAAVVREVLL